MAQPPDPSSRPASTLPPDDLQRQLTVARPNREDGLHHVSLAGDVYTILITGEETAGRYCLIDMLVPAGGGPPPHRHDFEEMFSILEGEIQVTFRGQPVIAHAGETVNIPANAPHFFRNVSQKTARLLCLCSPAGQEKYFLEVGIPVASRTLPAPKPSEAQARAMKEKAEALAAEYRTEFLPA
jgi:quercetin dioxygenase-like cupin family protein